MKYVRLLLCVLVRVWNGALRIMLDPEEGGNCRRVSSGQSYMVWGIICC